MATGNRKSAMRMMLLAGGLAAAVPLASIAAADPAPGPGSGPQKDNHDIVRCNGKPRNDARGSITCNGKPKRTARPKNGGFYCNMAPKTDPKKTAKPLTAPQ